MRHKNRFTILISVIFIIFILLTYQGIKQEGIEAPINYPLHLLSEVNSALINKMRGLFEKYIFIIDKADENKRLIQRVKMLEQKRNRFLEALEENKRLRMLLRLESQKHGLVTVAEVIARDPGNWFHLLWINKGFRHGIKRGMIAVAPDGLVGIIRDVSDDRASILLITDVNSTVAVRIQPLRIDGILEGRGNVMTYLKYIPKDAGVRPGQRIITSGLDGIYPKGILAGYVDRVKKTGDIFFQDITVRPAQNLNSVEEVAILRR